MGSFRVGPPMIKAACHRGIPSWRAAPRLKLGKRCGARPAARRNTFPVPAGPSYGKHGETQLCCFKSCVGAKLYVGDCPTFFLPSQKR